MKIYRGGSGFEGMLATLKKKKKRGRVYEVVREHLSSQPKIEKRGGKVYPSAIPLEERDSEKMSICLLFQDREVERGGSPHISLRRRGKKERKGFHEFAFGKTLLSDTLRKKNQEVKGEKRTPGR